MLNNLPSRSIPYIDLSTYANATMIRDLKQWKELGCKIDNREKSIDILVPTFQKEVEQTINKETNKILSDENGEQQTEVKETLSGYVYCKVFDVSQTSGESLTNVRNIIQKELKSKEFLNTIYKRFVDHVNSDRKNPLSILELNIENESSGGFYNRDTDNVVINTTVSKTTKDKFRVAIYEYAYGLLLFKSNDHQYQQGHKETQAESIAYIVSKYFGLETSPVSTGIIKSWAQDMGIAKKAVREIQQVSSHMIKQINSLQSEKIKEFYQITDSSKLKSELEEKLRIDLKEFPTLQLVDAKNGLVLFVKVEKNNRDKQYILRTNTNRYLPLSDLASRYYVINIWCNIEEV